MNIAFLGTRGVPAKYGGFETCAEELGKRLVERGHTITVYCHANLYSEQRKTYKGMNLYYVPGFKIKSLETLSHTFYALKHARKKPFDLILLFNIANTPLLSFSKSMRKKTVLHADGLEWKRKKWNDLGRKYFRLSAWLTSKYNFALICDSLEIQRYYRNKYGRKSQFIAYGAVPESSQDNSLLKKYGLEPNNYFLQITRFEPENNHLLSLQAFENIDTEKKLVFVGGAKYPTPYSEKLSNTTDPRVRFIGFIYDKNVLRELRCNAFAYIHGNEVGGTNPALLEAMAAGCFVVSRDVPYNREVLQSAGVYFHKSTEDLRNKLVWTLGHIQEKQNLAKKGKEIIVKTYNWESVVDSYENLFEKIVSS